MDRGRCEWGIIRCTGSILPCIEFPKRTLFRFRKTTLCRMAARIPLPASTSLERRRQFRCSDAASRSWRRGKSGFPSQVPARPALSSFRNPGVARRNKFRNFRSLTNSFAPVTRCALQRLTLRQSFPIALSQHDLSFLARFAIHRSISLHQRRISARDS